MIPHVLGLLGFSRQTLRTTVNETIAKINDLNALNFRYKKTDPCGKSAFLSNAI